MGGKFLLKKIVIDNFPDNYQDMIYIEPFVGGGSIIIKKEPSKEEIINDLDTDLIKLYKGFKKYSMDKIRKAVNKDWTKEDFQKIKDSNPKSDFDKFIRLFLLTRLSFFSQGRTWGGRGNVNIKSDYHNRLKNVKIFNTDYKELIKKFDSPNSFFYLDPPYEGSNKKHYKHHEFDYEKFKNILSKIKGKFLISINDSKNIRKIFKDFNIKNVKTKYTDPLKGGQNKIINELLIKNY